ncbi:MAG: hypothetical protein ABUK01_15565 [Leptospirales bacterium]
MRLENIKVLEIDDYLNSEVWQKEPDLELIEKVKKRVEKNKARYDKAKQSANI